MTSLVLIGLPVLAEQGRTNMGFEKLTKMMIVKILSFCENSRLCDQGLYKFRHMGPEHASREKKLPMVNFFIFVQKNVSRIRFQEIKIRPLKGFEKMRFLCFYIIGV